MNIAAIAVVIGLLACVIALAEVARATRLPYPTLMVIAGLLIGFIPGLPPLALDPELVFLVFLPPILYAAAWNTWLQDFRRHIASISLLAIGLVLFTALVVTWVVTAIVPGMPGWVGFLLGAIVAPPDAAAATAICQRLEVNRRIVTILEGESLVNDASGLIAYRVALLAIGAGTFSELNTARELAVAAVGGIAIGVAAGWLIAKLHSWITESNVATAISLLAPYVAYLPAEHFHVSGVLSVVVAGLYVSSRSPKLFTAEARLRAVNVWQLLILLLNGLVFVLIGLQLPRVIAAMRGKYDPATLIWYAAAVSATVLLARVVWVFPMARLLRWFTPARFREPTPPWRQMAVVAWTGMRGVVSLAAAMAIPEFVDAQSGVKFPYRDLVILLTFAVIFATLVLQSLTLAPLIRWLGESVTDSIEHEELVARMVGASAATKYLEELEANNAEDAAALARVRADYLDRQEMAVAEARGDVETTTKGRATPRDRVRRMAIDAERRAIVDLRLRGEVSEEVFRRIERDLDLEESRLS
ncbi:MAG: Na+/H+ antiporter [Planctomycetes bacterium]|nr:Na+/H+ antiporter [Planctomycetota bacterium]